MPANSSDATSTVDELLKALASSVPTEDQPAFAERADLLRRLLVSNDEFLAKRFIAEEVARALQV